MKGGGVSFEKNVHVEAFQWGLEHVLGFHFFSFGQAVIRMCVAQ